MSEQWQIRRGTTVENDDFTGAEGEITMDTEKKQLRVHDGQTQGGAGIIDPIVAFQVPTADNGYTWYRKYRSGWVEQGGITDYMAWNGTGASKTEILPVPMSDTNYVATATMLDSTTNWNYPGCAIRSMSTTQISVCIATAGNNQGSSRCSWEVKGMAA